MGEKEYLYYFTPERKDRFRYYHDLVHGKIVRFVVQYEAYLDGKWNGMPLCVTTQYTAVHTKTFFIQMGHRKSSSLMVAPETKY